MTKTEALDALNVLFKRHGYRNEKEYAIVRDYILSVDDSCEADTRESFCTVFKSYINTDQFEDLVLAKCQNTTKHLDCFNIRYDTESETVYISNRETGAYISWYKLSHLGRALEMSGIESFKMLKKFIEEFAYEFDKEPKS